LGASWDIYDRLINGIGSDVVAGACLISTWTVVDTKDEGMGLAMTFRGGPHDSHPLSGLAGTPLRELAGHLKSWDLRKASIGMAAVNAYYNAPDRVRSWLKSPLEAIHSSGVFLSVLDRIEGKKVTVIGHFPGLEKAANRAAELNILERNPSEGDLPDFAAEYILPEQDYVFITGTALTNKTLPRLLDLSKNAIVALVGPSVPLVPWWFDLGIDMLAGTVVVDKPSVWQRALEGAHKGIFDAGGWMVDIHRDDVAVGLPQP
jgi:uncharacterized protein (DUF4213/DUF364 family)